MGKEIYEVCIRMIPLFNDQKEYTHEEYFEKNEDAVKFINKLNASDHRSIVNRFFGGYDRYRLMTFHIYCIELNSTKEDLEDLMDDLS